MNDWKFEIFDPAAFARPARPVTRVFLHCTASDLPHLKGVALAEEVNRWHLANGWAGVGYHFLVDKEGQVVTGRPLDLVPSAQLGKDGRGNLGTIAISTHGGWSFTAAGLQATKALCAAIAADYADQGGTVTFHGHCEIDPRPCPVYSYKTLLGLNPAGIMGAATEVPAEIVAACARNPALPSVTPTPPALLKLGDRGDEVSALEKALGLASNGCFDGAVDAAVRAQQAAHHLAVDGVVGPNTRAALGLA